MVDPPGKCFLFQIWFPAVIVPIWLGERLYTHLPQGHDPLVGILHIPHQDIGPEAGGSRACLSEIGCGPLHHREHIVGIAGHPDKAYPVEPGQQFRGLRDDQPCVQTLVEIDPRRFPSHAVDLLQAKV